MNWTQIKVSCKTSDLDSVTAVMSMLDTRLMIEDYSDVSSGFNEIYGELLDESIINADKTYAKVSMYLEEDKNYNDYLLFLKDRFRALKLDCEIEILGVDDEDWANNWKKYYNPQKIGEHIVIVPMWQDYDADDGDIIVKMDPGLAFGSGTHETTRLCATLIEKHMDKNCKRVLDIGTGSGILAIVESKLGADRIFAYDIDPVAARVAVENAEKNGINNITAGVSDLLADVDTEGGLYDFVSANIVADIIIRMAPDLHRVMKYGAKIAVSGVIEDRFREVIEVMERNGFGVSDIITENDWKGMVFTRLSGN